MCPIRQREVRCAVALPVSTTHVLSSGIAGTMTANGSGLQLATIRNIAMVWVLTLPAAMLISAACIGASRGCSEQPALLRGARYGQATFSARSRPRCLPRRRIVVPFCSARVLFLALGGGSRQCSGMSAIESKSDGSVDAAGTAAKIGTLAERSNCLNVSQKRDTDRRAYLGSVKTKYCGAITISAEIWSPKSRAGNRRSISVVGGG